MGGAACGWLNGSHGGAACGWLNGDAACGWLDVIRRVWRARGLGVRRLFRKQGRNHLTVVMVKEFRFGV